MYNSIKAVLIMLLMSAVFTTKAQEIGYIGGVSKIGISPSSFQPLYGFSVSKVFSKYLAAETNLFYSQRLLNDLPQADYLSFSAMPQLGWFDSKKGFGLYAGPAIVLNPCLYHSNLENHTYLSTYLSAGIRKTIVKKVILDFRAGYDIGLTGGYYNNGYSKYKGVMLQAALKFDLTCQ
jgi:hypothetical protein